MLRIGVVLVALMTATAVFADAVPALDTTTEAQSGLEQFEGTCSKGDDGSIVFTSVDGKVFTVERGTMVRYVLHDGRDNAKLVIKACRLDGPNRLDIVSYRMADGSPTLHQLQTSEVTRVMGEKAIGAVGTGAPTSAKVNKSQQAASKPKSSTSAAKPKPKPKKSSSSSSSSSSRKK